ncbi:MAG: RidA family protein [Gemmatimonadetes bacterium]|jgi:enamine deaminase RidA (YjgF/YER057c/UK114 family)|nr:RidA family protein [Gemmatimonadota bacterium]MBT5142144.1 RidA family protein [Gemmatimonadota bacterium]MBT7597371.1 RidA family protein [Gemmatimonadota bacterium]
MAHFEEIHTSNASHEGWPYSEAVRAGDFIFVAGVAAEDETTGQIIGATIVEQTHKTFHRIAGILRHADADLRDICRLSVHLNNIEDFGEFSAAYAEIFHWTPKPTRITRGSALAPGLLLEVECTVYKPK